MKTTERRAEATALLKLGTDLVNDKPAPVTIHLTKAVTRVFNLSTHQVSSQIS